MSLNIIQLFIPNSLRNFNYILYSEENKNALVFDPYEAELIKAAIEKKDLKVVGLINTHAHHDHIRHNENILHHYKCPLIELKDQEKFYLSETDYILSLSTPGHIDPHFCYEAYSDDKAWGLISGDLLFNAGVGNCKNGGNVETLYKTITETVSKLSDKLLLFPSHDYFLTNLRFSLSLDTENKDVKDLIAKREKQKLDQEFIQTDLGLERKINPFLSLSKFKNKFKNSSEKEIFKKIRSLRDNW